MDTTKAKKKPSPFTLKRGDIAREELRIRTLEVAEWLAINMDIEALKKVQTTDALFDVMLDGILPCRIIEKYFKEVAIKFNPNAAPKSFIARDNVQKFIDACKKLGVKQLFDSTDLVDRKNEKIVLNTILELSKKCMKAGVKPPMMVQYQMECEQIEQQHKDKLAQLVEKKDPEPPKPAVSQEEPIPGKKKKDEDQPPRAPLSPQAPAAAPPPAPPAIAAESPTSTGGAAAAESAASPSAPAAEDEDEEEEALEEEEADKAEGEKAAAAPAPKKEKAKIDVEKYKKVKPSKIPCYRTTHLKYYPIPGDDIDNAIADMVNRYVLTVEIRRVQLVSKSGELIMLKGEYVIGGDWVHVRLIQKTLVVFHQNECYNFLHFCQLKMGFELF